MNNIKGIPDAIILIAACLLLLGYCTPAPASEDRFDTSFQPWGTPEDRAAVQFDRYKADSDRYADRLYWQEQRTQRELDRQRERDWHRIYDQRFDKPRRSK